MIVEMKKATVLCLDSERVKALEDLRELGVLHASIFKRPDSSDCEAVAKEIASVEATANILTNYKPSGEQLSLSGKETCEKAVALIDEEVVANQRFDLLFRERERLEPWGEFTPKAIEDLKYKGIHVYLCVGAQADIDALPEGATSTIISKAKGALHYAVVSREKLDPMAIHAIQLPQLTMSEVDAEMAKAKEAAAKAKAGLGALASNAKAIEAYRKELLEKLDFLTHRDSMSVSGVVSYIEGYVPVTAVAKITEAAQAKGWGLMINEPTADDNPPTLLENPKWMKIIDPLFEMIGIAPGYREFDVTIFFLIFFTIFFGMIVADAGYALCFLAIALLARFLVKNPALKLPLNLFALLSVSAFVWGWINGVFFGIPIDKLPFAFMRGLPMFSDPATSPFACDIAHKFGMLNDKLFEESKNFCSLNEESKEAIRKAMESMPDKFTQWFCFFLAAVHLSGARLFRTVAEIKHNWHAISDLGWAIIIWANFFTAVQLIVFNGSFPSFGIWLYVAAVVLIFGGMNWHDSGHVLHTPFALIGSFTDVLSYIRLFAVGMSGLFIAKCFNNMGGMANAIPYAGILLAIGVILFGHFLNIALAFLGVLVHAIRLNSLEFSNQMELQWTGVKYKPFAKTQQIKDKE